MVNVRIPCDDPKIIEECKKEALFKFNTFIPVFKFNNGKFYARFSALIYNDITDHIYAANALLELINQKLNILIKSRKF